MKLRALAFVAFLALGVLPCSAYFSGTWFEGADGWEEASRRSRSLDAPMFVYFRVDWCPHCKAFDELLDDPAVRARLAKVVKVVVDPEKGEAERRLFREAYGGSGYPTLFLQRPGRAPVRISHRGPAERFLVQLPADD